MDDRAKELALNAQAIELKKQQDAHSFEIAKRSLDVQSKDLIDERRHRLEIWKLLSRLALCGIVALTAVAVTALFFGKEQFVLELLKIALYGGSGAAMGIFYQRGRRGSSADEG